MVSYRNIPTPALRLLALRAAAWEAQTGKVHSYRQAYEAELQRRKAA